MRITRTDAPKEGAKQDPGSLEGMTVEELQRTLTALTTRKTLERDRAVLIRMITKLRKQKEDKLEAKADAEAPTPTVTQRLVAIANMKLPELRETYRDLYGKPSLSRSRKALLVRIAERLQADEVAAETPAAPLAKPTLTVKFERTRGKKSGGKAKGRPKAKAAAQGKETATSRRTTRPAGQRDPRLPKPGTTIQRVYKGRTLLVRVLEDGFEYDGKPYRSLSALAKKVTGQIVNGMVWWGLGLPSKEKKSS